MFLSSLGLILVMVLSIGSESSAKVAPVNQWLLGYEAQIESAVSLATVGNHEPKNVTDYALELAITDLALVSSRLEDRLDSCRASQRVAAYCSPVSSNKKSFDLFRRKILARRALITFFRNFLVQELNKLSAQRNFANALRMGLKIKNI